MEILFKDFKLEELYKTGKSPRFHPEIVRSFIMKVNFLKQAITIRDLYAMKGFHYEKLSGDREWKHSIRLNGSRRLVFTVDQIWNLQVIGIEEITNHYQ